MIRIDSHHHFWKYDPIRDSWIDDSMKILQNDFMPASFAHVLQNHNMAGSVTVQADQSENETKFLLDLASENDFIKGVVGWVDLRKGDIENRLESYKDQKKLCGFRHIAQSEPDDMFLVNQDFIHGLKYLEKYQFTYDILVYPKQLKAAIELVNRLPDQKFVLDHIAKPLIREGIMDPWSDQIYELASAKNVYCKVSGIITEADHNRWTVENIIPYLEVVFDAFGTKRLMFGSDWPVCLLAGSYSQVVDLVDDFMETNDMPDKDKVWGGNAIEFYGLKLED